MSTDPAAPLRLGYVPGVTPGRWARTWRERLPEVPLELVFIPHLEAEPAVRAGGVDALLGRLPIVTDGVMHAIPLYTEVTVIAAALDHFVAAADTLDPSDLSDEVLAQPRDDALPWREGPKPGLQARETPDTTAEAVAFAATGAGVVALPLSLARLHHRKDVIYRPISALPASEVALLWRKDRGDDRIDELVGIVRGRTVNSSRGRRGSGDPERSGPSRTRDGANDTGSSGRRAGQKVKPRASRRHSGSGGRPSSARRTRGRRSR